MKRFANKLRIKALKRSSKLKRTLRNTNGLGPFNYGRLNRSERKSLFSRSGIFMR